MYSVVNVYLLALLYHLIFFFFRIILVWLGLDWIGLVWFGLVWFDLVWFSLVWFGPVWFGLVWFGRAREGFWLRSRPNSC